MTKGQQDAQRRRQIDALIRANPAIDGLRQIAAQFDLTIGTLRQRRRTLGIAVPNGRKPKPIACVHCGKIATLRPRHLCWHCYEDRDIRHATPIVSYHGLRGADSNPVRKPCKPTTAFPGSKAKIEVLAQRAANGEELFHPDDLQGTLD